MSNVQLNADTIVINGQPKILLCASLFYFRIPRENWEERMKQLRMLGYNCIDVYMPWNFHESSPNVWNFEGMYDVDAFLALATQYQLYVIARPGPYICSEWDGGALPSWLYKADIELRQDEPEYLKQLERWLQRILPIIAAHEVDRGGSVVAVQLENEMDYFACKAPEQYMRKLQKTALCYGITVPLTACAGQCDVQGAGGLVQGVHPTFNAYSDDTFAHLECQLAHMRALAAELGTPLMITETDRIHAKVKRELASGARLISPYNQVGGSNVDMTNGISNWAEDVHRPLALMASDYDFDSMLTVSGRLRAQAGQARLLGSLIASLGIHLATAKPCESPIKLTCDFPTARMLGQDGRDVNWYPSLQMDCGWLICATNLGTSAGNLYLPVEDALPCVCVEPGETKLLPWQLSLVSWGSDCVILWSEAELCSVHVQEENKYITLVGNEDARAKVSYNAKSTIVAGKEWICVGMDTWFRVLLPEHAIHDCPALPALCVDIPSKIRIRNVESVLSHPFQLRDYAKPVGNGICAMEEANVFRGDVFYEFSTIDDAPLLLKAPADFLWACRGTRAKACFCDGASILLEGGKGEWSLRTQSWGHANFDDVRQPSLKMGAKKGISGMIRVLEQQDVTELWFIYPADKYLCQGKMELRNTDRILATTINTWNYPASPMHADYVRKVYLRSDCDCFWLHVERGGARMTAWVDGKEAGSIHDNDPWLELSAVAKPGQCVELRLEVTRNVSHESLGRVTLVSGQSIQNGKMYAVSAQAWQTLFPQEAGQQAILPLSLAVGEERMLTDVLPQGERKQRMLVLEGSGAEVTLIAHEHVCGRVQLPTEGYPEVRGGSGRRIYLPEQWADSTVCIHVCGIGQGGMLAALRWEEIVS